MYLAPYILYHDVSYSAGGRTVDFENTHCSQGRPGVC